MGEDRRPNVGGRPLDDETPKPEQQAASDEELRQHAELLAARSGVDGHEQEAEAEAEEG